MLGCDFRQQIEMEPTCDKSLQKFFPKGEKALPNEEYAQINLALDLLPGDITIGPVRNCHLGQLFAFVDVEYRKSAYQSSKIYLQNQKVYV